MGELVNSLRGDKNLDHPKAGAAAKTAKERTARMDMERACAIVLGIDRVLAQIAQAEGHDRAIAAAEIFGFNADSYRDMRDMRMKAVRQSSIRYGSSFDPDNDSDMVRALLASGKFTMEQLNAARRQAIREHLAANPDKIIGPPGTYKVDDGETHAPVQRTLRSSNPAAAFNADRGARA